MKVANEGWVGKRVSDLFTFRFTSCHRAFIGCVHVVFTSLYNLIESRIAFVYLFNFVLSIHCCLSLIHYTFSFTVETIS